MNAMQFYSHICGYKKKADVKPMQRGRKNEPKGINTEKNLKEITN